MTEQEQKLFDALQTERNRFASNLHDTTDHDYALTYLRTKQLPPIHKDFIAKKYPALDACINDFKQMYADYVTNP